MAKNKTKPTNSDVEDFLDALPDERRRADGRAVTALMQRVTGEPPVMWGPTIVGFGSYQYRYDSGRQGESPLIGFSPRAKETVLYLFADARDRDALLARLGPHKTGKSCLYVKRLAEVDQNVLETLLKQSVKAIRERYPG